VEEQQERIALFAKGPTTEPCGHAWVVRPRRVPSTSEGSPQVPKASCSSRLQCPPPEGGVSEEPAQETNRIRPVTSLRRVGGRHPDARSFQRAFAGRRSCMRLGRSVTFAEVSSSPGGRTDDSGCLLEPPLQRPVQRVRLQQCRRNEPSLSHAGKPGSPGGTACGGEARRVCAARRVSPRRAHDLSMRAA